MARVSPIEVWLLGLVSGAGWRLSSRMSSKPIYWGLLASALLCLDYWTGAYVVLAVLLIVPVSGAAWFHGRTWGLILALAPFVRLSFRIDWEPAAPLFESVVSEVIRFGTFAAFAVLVDLVARQRAEIRVLRGILPTCAWCKSIRDPEDRWQPMEAYISKRSDVIFTHGICPKCEEEHFGVTEEERK